MWLRDKKESAGEQEQEQEQEPEECEGRGRGGMQAVIKDEICYRKRDVHRAG
jgi:hypothetical protein